VALGVLDQTEILVLVERAGIDVAVEVVGKGANVEGQVAFGLAQGKFVVLRRLFAVVGVVLQPATGQRILDQAALIRVGGQMDATCVQLLRVRRALRAGGGDGQRQIRVEIPYRRAGERSGAAAVGRAAALVADRVVPDPFIARAKLEV